MKILILMLLSAFWGSLLGNLLAAIVELVVIPAGIIVLVIVYHKKIRKFLNDA